MSPPLPPPAPVHSPEVPVEARRAAYQARRKDLSSTFDFSADYADKSSQPAAPGQDVLAGEAKGQDAAEAAKAESTVQEAVGKPEAVAPAPEKPGDQPKPKDVSKTPAEIADDAVKSRQKPLEEFTESDKEEERVVDVRFHGAFCFFFFFPGCLWRRIQPK